MRKEGKPKSRMASIFPTLLVSVFLVYGCQRLKDAKQTYFGSPSNDAPKVGLVEQRNESQKWFSQWVGAAETLSLISATDEALLSENHGASEKALLVLQRYVPKNDVESQIVQSMNARGALLRGDRGQAIERYARLCKGAVSLVVLDGCTELIHFRLLQGHEKEAERIVEGLIPHPSDIKKVSAWAREKDMLSHFVSIWPDAEATFDWHLSQLAMVCSARKASLPWFNSSILHAFSRMSDAQLRRLAARHLVLERAKTQGMLLASRGSQTTRPCSAILEGALYLIASEYRIPALLPFYFLHGAVRRDESVGNLLFLAGKVGRKDALHWLRLAQTELGSNESYQPLKPYFHFIRFQQSVLESSKQESSEVLADFLDSAKVVDSFPNDLVEFAKSWSVNAYLPPTAPKPLCDESFEAQSAGLSVFLCGRSPASSHKAMNLKHGRRAARKELIFLSRALEFQLPEELDKRLWTSPSAGDASKHCLEKMADRMGTEEELPACRIALLQSPQIWRWLSRTSL